MTRASFQTVRPLGGPAAAALFLAVACLSAGCMQDVEKVEFPPPALPAGGEGLAEQWYTQWVDQPDVPGEGVSDMLFILGTRGRDWRQPAGPDGYVLRAILLDENDKPVRADGMFRAFVVAGPNARDARAVKAWRIGPEQAARRFSEDQWPGYLLELDWLDGLPTRHGVFMLVVRWRGPDETARFTRNVIFEDVNYEQPYKRTLPPGAVEAPQGPAGGDPGPGGADPAGGDSR